MDPVQSRRKHFDATSRRTWEAQMSGFPHSCPSQTVSSTTPATPYARASLNVESAASIRVSTMSEALQAPAPGSGVKSKTGADRTPDSLPLLVWLLVPAATLQRGPSTFEPPPRGPRQPSALKGGGLALPHWWLPRPATVLNSPTLRAF